MPLGMSARDKRTLIVGGSVVGALFMLGRGLPALTAWQTTQATNAASAVAELAAARTGARIMPALRDSVRARQARVASIDSTILSGATPAAAAADLASALEQIATESAVKVSAMQLHADSAGPGALVQVGVRMTAVADVYGLLALLRAIEGGDELLAVREIAVSQPDPTAPSGKPESLRLDVMVIGLARLAGTATTATKETRE